MSTTSDGDMAPGRRQALMSAARTLLALSGAGILVRLALADNGCAAPTICQTCLASSICPSAAPMGPETSATGSNVR